jgi:hypothetical protein
MPLIQVQAPFVDSLDFGVGVNSTNASPMGKVVEGEITGLTGRRGQKSGLRSNASLPPTTSPVNERKRKNHEMF